MLALILSVQLYASGPVVRWRVASCEPAMSLWLSAAEAWADQNHIAFTGAASCGLNTALPKGYVEVMPVEGKPYLLPEF